MTTLTEPVRVQYIGVELDATRRVFVGYPVELADSGYFFKFVDAEGRETKIRLSSEAVAAVAHLIPVVDIHRSARRVQHIAVTAVSESSEGETL